MKTRRQFQGLIVAASVAVAFFVLPAFITDVAHAQGAGVGRPPAQIKHFDPNGNLPSTFTLELRKGITASSH